MVLPPTIAWYWHRLRAMDSTEIAGRIAEKTRVWTDAKKRGELNTFRLGPAQAEALRLPDAATASDRLKERIAAKAAAVRQGQWLLFGWREVVMPDPPAWGWDAHHDLEAPLAEPVASLDHRHLASGADPRAIWEINRWSEIVVLAQNAWLNQHPADAALAQRWLSDWCVRNPLGHGINWTSSLEAGIRLINFCWIDALLRATGDEAIRPTQDRLASQIVPNHAWWIWRHRSFGSSANNHLIGELAALVLSAQRWPSVMHIACCAEKTWSMLEKEVLRQFAEDGGNLEQALHYHLFAWDLAWQCRRVMGHGSAAFNERLDRAGQFFAALAHPHEPWDFGDSDDAEVTPLTWDRRSTVAEWQAWFHHQPSSESLRFWLGKAPTASKPDHPSASADTWQLFETSGLAVKRCGPWMARLDASPLGFGKMAAHGHLDALHVSLWLGCKAIFIDPGTGAYYDDPALRTALADWSAHNGPLPCAGRPAPLRMGAFLWTQHHEPPKLRMEDGDAVACLACDGPFVKRQVRLEADRCEMLDAVCNEQPHAVLFTLAPAWQIQQVDAQHFCLTHAEDEALQLRFESPDPLKIDLTEVTVSPHFGQKALASALHISFTRALKTRVQRAD
jgi:hypothetical protein